MDVDDKNVRSLTLRYYPCNEAVCLQKIYRIPSSFLFYGGPLLHLYCPCSSPLNHVQNQLTVSVDFCVDVCNVFSIVVALDFKVHSKHYDTRISQTHAKFFAMFGFTFITTIIVFGLNNSRLNVQLKILYMQFSICQNICTVIVCVILNIHLTSQHNITTHGK